MRFNLLGHMVVSIGGVDLLLHSAKQRTLLALLAFNVRQPVAKDVIMNELWPEQDQSASTSTLRTHVLQLRKSISDAGAGPRARDILRAVGGGYQLCDAEARLDSDEFTNMVAAGRRASRVGDYLTADTRFSEALAIWRGPMLADVPRGPRLESATRQLEETKLLVHGHEADIKLRLGLHREMLPELARLAQDYPLDEGIALRYMIALDRCGRRADALRHFQQLRRRLGEDLGLDPSNRLQEVHSAILGAHTSIELPQFA
jgi:DNA-binding SARP family transcriptional activator